MPAAIAPAFDRLRTVRTGAAMDALLTELRTATPASAIALDAEQEQYFVSTVADILRSTLPSDGSAPFADSKSDERSLAASVSLPLFRVYRCMYQFEERLRKPVAQLLRSVLRRMEQPIGHLMLYYLKVTAKLQSRSAAAAAAAAAGGGMTTPTTATSAAAARNTTPTPTGAAAAAAASAVSSSSSAATTPTQTPTPTQLDGDASNDASNVSASAAGSGAVSPTSLSEIVAAGSGGFKKNVYRLLCEWSGAADGDSSVDACLARDLGELETSSVPVFLWLLPDVVREFKPALLNNSAVLRVLCGCLDARGLRDLIYAVTQGKLVLFRNEGVIGCVRDSLEYETFEQYCLWQLVLAHDVPIEYLQVSDGVGAYPPFRWWGCL